MEQKYTDFHLVEKKNIKALNKKKIKDPII